MATLSEKRKTLEQLQFIHQRLTQTSQYFMGEFDIAKDSAVLITDMFNKLQADVDSEQKALEESNSEKAPE